MREATIHHYSIIKSASIFVYAVCENHLKGFAVRKLALLSFLAMAEVWEKADIFWHLDTNREHFQCLTLVTYSMFNTSYI